MDLTEKMAFFEAYGAIAGATGAQGAERHPAAARAAQDEGASGDAGLRRHGAGPDPDAEARELLQRAAEDKDLVVRNAVNRALRESAA